MEWIPNNSEETEVVTPPSQLSAVQQLASASQSSCEQDGAATPAQAPSTPLNIKLSQQSKYYRAAASVCKVGSRAGHSLKTPAWWLVSTSLPPRAKGTWSAPGRTWLWFLQGRGHYQ